MHATAQLQTPRSYIVTAALLAGSLALTACGAATGADASEDANEALELTIGISDLNPSHEVIAEVALEKGFDITWQSFSDWTLPNQGLTNEELDANAFQHLAFLSAFNVAENQDLIPVGSTTITTWGLYSADHDDAAAIPDGATIAIPNDPSNGARALFLLEAAGLIELTDDVGVYPTEDDIVGNPKNLTFNAVVAQQLVNVYPDVEAVVIGAQTIDQGLSITQAEALYTDDPNAESSRPYVNVVAVRNADADDETFEELLTVWQDPRVADALEEESKGNTVIVDQPVEDLRSTLTELEELAHDLEN